MSIVKGKRFGYFCSLSNPILLLIAENTRPKRNTKTLQKYANLLS